MMAAMDGSTVVDRIRDEHKRIFALIHELEATFGARTDLDEWIATVTHRLVDLGELLAPHFRFERDSALYSDAPTRAPHLATRLDRLLGQHATFLTELGSILALARGTLDPDEELRKRLTTRIAALFAEMRQHEAAETELLGDAFQDDLGVGD
jgi:hypothetical protein